MMLWWESDGAYYYMLLHYNYLFTDSKTLMQILILYGFLIDIFPGNFCKSTGNKLIDTVNEIFDLSARKRRLQLSENLLLAPMFVGVTRSEDKDIKAALFSLFLRLKSSFSFTVTLINIHNDPSQFPPCSLRFVSTRMLYSTEVSTWVLYLMRSTSCFISWVPSLLESGTKRPFQENEEEELEIISADLLDTLHN